MAKRTKSLIENRQKEEAVRINKYLSDAGICSRREADKYISEGKVTINGVIAVMGSKVQTEDTVMLDNKPVNIDEALAFIAFNKPRGIVCTTDKRIKDNIIDYIQYPKRIYPVGRLDKESEGLILLTNDGDIVDRILRAGNNHEKEYIVTVNKTVTAEFITGMSSGVPILDTITRPCEIKALDRFRFRIILTQGMNRQIRRMCEYFGYKVLTLKRTRIMNINLGHLQVGGYRNITEKEIIGLNELISNSVNIPNSLWNSMEDASDLEKNRIIEKNRGKNGRHPKKNDILKYSGTTHKGGGKERTAGKGKRDGKKSVPFKDQGRKKGRNGTKMDSIKTNQSAEKKTNYDNKGNKTHSKTENKNVRIKNGESTNVTRNKPDKKPVGLKSKGRKSK